MPPKYFPLRWESTGDQWWFASPIDWAAANGHYDLVRELLHLDTNLLIKLTSLRRIRRLETVWDDEKQFDDVAKCRAVVARKLLLECESGKGHNSLIRAGYGGWLLYTAASAGDSEFVSELLDRDPFLVFGEGEYGITDLLYAAARGKNSGVFWGILESAVLMGRSEEQGGSVFRWEVMNRAVHAAARGGNLDLLKEILLDSSDVLLYRDSQGSTLLHTASGRGQAEVVKYLLASYDIVNTVDNEGNTALHVAAYRGYLPVVEVLVSASPSSASLTNNYGDTFLHMAVAGFRSPGFRRLDRQIELIKKLVRSKILDIEDIINITNNDGRTALHMAVAENVQTDLVELLMTARSIHLNIRDNDGNTPLDLLRQRPRSASSEILIKRLILAGGISNCNDHKARSALASHLKMQGIGASPGTSFRIPDAEIYLYTGVENAYDAISDYGSTDFGSCSGELRSCDSGAETNSVYNNSKWKAARRLKYLMHWAMRKEKKAELSNLRDDHSTRSYEVSSRLDDTPVPLRQRYSRGSSLPNNKRVLSFMSTPPSPSTKRKFTTRLMQGVIQVMPRSTLGSPSSSFSESTWSSPVSTRKVKGVVESCAEPSSSNRLPNRDKSKQKRGHGSFNVRLMNQYFCFGAEGLAVENPISCTQQDEYRRHTIV